MRVSCFSPSVTVSSTVKVSSIGVESVWLIGLVWLLGSESLAVEVVLRVSRVALALGWLVVGLVAGISGVLVVISPPFRLMSMPGSIVWRWAVSL